LDRFPAALRDGNRLECLLVIPSCALLVAVDAVPFTALAGAHGLVAFRDADGEDVRLAAPPGESGFLVHPLADLVAETAALFGFGFWLRHTLGSAHADVEIHVAGFALLARGDDLIVEVSCLERRATLDGGSRVRTAGREREARGKQNAFQPHDNSPNPSAPFAVEAKFPGATPQIFYGKRLYLIVQQRFGNRGR
jgi:hypothetical protein